MKTIGTSKISSKLRVCMPKDVADALQVEDGDFILYQLNEKTNEVVIKKA
ncbi:AbrB/MazE/SpoVT family DNA-binding domain-containing protein [Methanomassiliicoccus luminyensis]|nr:AbrB/MazE/SpoVT family DNA-binding domain-containing protein [Methanomassiliicoccus luminyensis]